MTDLPPLVDKIKSYNPDFNPQIVEAAIAFAKDKHEGQTRSSGEPYYTHPVAVASILAEMKLDLGSILTAILHDTIEDTDATYDDLKDKFGCEVADLVDGVSKLTRIESKTVEGKQAENFRKLLLAMSEDIRVLLVKLADRLHNMRTIEGIKNPEKRRRIALETLEIYVPLAERIGVHKIKGELEDLAFSILNPEARESIAKRLAFLRAEGTDLVDDIIAELKKSLEDVGIKAEISGREKTGYSIWKKMQRKNVAFEQLSDIMAFRIVVGSVEQCYATLGLIHSHYPSIPGRFKDYISTPKPNGYRSIHTTVMGPARQRIEIQIRTSEMHYQADMGVAAHWAYKQGGQPMVQDVKKYRWLRELLEILEQEQQPEDFWENTKLELFQEHVFAFSPKGDLIELPSGATPIDFAYAIHSDIGDRCVGAKINGRIAPLNTRLANGDQVDIITSKTQQPSPTWERFVVTGKARSHIRKFVRNRQRNEYVTLGKAMLQKIFRQEGYEFSEKGVSGILKQFKAEENDDIYARIGSGTLVARDAFKAIFPAHKTAIAKRPSADMDQAVMVRPLSGSDAPMPIKGLIPGMAVHFARCCHPLPGDRIVGIVTTGKGVTIHTIDCETLETFADTPERWLDVSWGEGPDSPEAHVGRINITLQNEPGTLATLSTVIASNGGNITNLKITSRSVDFWQILVDVYVNDTKHLSNIIAALRATPIISSVERAKGQ
ncbi:MAG TPA: bifunctional (p)ppGpp synthetase/guanosine-3',5'-bis(diphosphate) 3'-pyrophosphohydrolase [Alphaproteobacteria bacterium]|nr:bifunctional (p)ppGpp synthetase/guanosine-3',5'-bis(diphosphate) 3'-pyrophosphohydrolase [Alphaproteobacteria bacterium]USO05055.1 MAG: bifunctional (p)ppGpp synthetase/guanosine-3',5'-bis(diphosphate) 3'-pyrophosphohydrolase [Rhodospirillales bacterium]HOO81673.1 bifunctional (p)ppGpp synthetase/guanosine-3',5'-bis(diphosphate) 3'-pyrophosphohydrolase [Alphaproteobacteria bacterium]